VAWIVCAHNPGYRALQSCGEWRDLTTQPPPGRVHLHPFPPSTRRARSPWTGPRRHLVHATRLPLSTRASRPTPSCTSRYTGNRGHDFNTPHAAIPLSESASARVAHAMKFARFRHGLTPDDRLAAHIPSSRPTTRRRAATPSPSRDHTRAASPPPVSTDNTAQDALTLATLSVRRTSAARASPWTIPPLHARRRHRTCAATTPPPAAAGDTLRVALLWHPSPRPADDYKVFVHLLTPPAKPPCGRQQPSCRWFYPPRTGKPATTSRRPRPPRCPPTSRARLHPRHRHVPEARDRLPATTPTEHACPTTSGAENHTSA
jgi:hypothetical protein